MNEYIGMNSHGMGFGWSVSLLFIIIFIYFINNLIKSDSSPRDILDKKYANGEIDEKEYIRRKKVLGGAL